MNFKLDRKFFLEQVRDLAIIFIVSTITLYFTCNSCFLKEANTFKYIYISFIAWIVFWKGNEFCTKLVGSRISWVSKPLLRFLVGMIVMLVYTSLAILFLQYLTYLVGISRNALPGVKNFIMPLVYTSAISLTLHAIMFLKSWRLAEINVEKLKNQQLSSQYEALKNQVNPHFLFNSLNALTNLVYLDQDLAAKFIKQLSEVYRYVLDNREKELVSLETELTFVESYVFLQQIRFGENLKYEVKIPDGFTCKVPPLSVQMLIENAIKHNVISSADPLIISIEIEDDKFLVVKNNLQVKNIINEPSSGIGLENIKARYEFLSEKKVVVEEDKKEFVVKLPLIGVRTMMSL
jgi:sensor histidine kinase YesM